MSEFSLGDRTTDSLPPTPPHTKVLNLAQITPWAKEIQLQANQVECKSVCNRAWGHDPFKQSSLHCHTPFFENLILLAIPYWQLHDLSSLVFSDGVNSGHRPPLNQSGLFICTWDWNPESSRPPAGCGCGTCEML